MDKLDQSTLESGDTVYVLRTSLAANFSIKICKAKVVTACRSCGRSSVRIKYMCRCKQRDFTVHSTNVCPLLKINKTKAAAYAEATFLYIEELESIRANIVDIKENFLYDKLANEAELRQLKRSFNQDLASETKDLAKLGKKVANLKRLHAQASTKSKAKPRSKKKHEVWSRHEADVDVNPTATGSIGRRLIDKEGR